MSSKYDDIINLPHHVSKKHPQMSLEARAAQFAPFAALTGYEDEVEEAGRLTDKRLDLDEEAKKDLDSKMQIIRKKISAKPVITFTYFVPDLQKDGGKYVTVTGAVRRIDEYKQVVVLEDKNEIPINEIVGISWNGL